MPAQQGCQLHQQGRPNSETTPLYVVLENENIFLNWNFLWIILFTELFCTHRSHICFRSCQLRQTGNMFSGCKDLLDRFSYFKFVGDSSDLFLEVFYITPKQELMPRDIQHGRLPWVIFLYGTFLYTSEPLLFPILLGQVLDRFSYFKFVGEQYAQLVST